MDIVIFYGSEEYVVELKRWYGPKKDEEGIGQLANYPDARGQNRGWLLTFCFLQNKDKVIEDYTREVLIYEGKEISTYVV